MWRLVSGAGASAAAFVLDRVVIRAVWHAWALAARYEVVVGTREVVAALDAHGPMTAARVHDVLSRNARGRFGWVSKVHVERILRDLAAAGRLIAPDADPRYRLAKGESSRRWQ